MAALSLSKLVDEAQGALDTATHRISSLFNPTIRLGITGLSRSGKTVFITSLVQNLINEGKLPLFKARQEGRIAKILLQPQPDDDIPRFAIEDHINHLLNERNWPESTRSISQLRLTIEFERSGGWANTFAPNRLNLDIIDYPGEWLLDLPLLSQTYQEFSKNAVELAQLAPRNELSNEWLELANKLDPQSEASEPDIAKIADAFTRYLRECKHDSRALSTLPPGRFLMPVDLEGSPAVTFAPLPNIDEISAEQNSLLATMERRFESYKSKVIWPFYNNHFARLDRQVILVDALQALNAGREAVVDLERALGDILLSFNVGKSSFPFNLLSRKIDRILIAATKADHLHHENHDRLEQLAEHLVKRAECTHDISKIDTQVIALAAVRATKEAKHTQNGDELPVIIGTPRSGEKLGDNTFDGKVKKAIFPGDLPENPDSIFEALESDDQAIFDQLHKLNFIRFRPPELENANKKTPLPHIRMDRAIEFLIGDKLA